MILEPLFTLQKFETQVYDEHTKINVLGKYIGKLEISKELQ